jgi:type II secretory pathway pseudopilin PulG
MDCSPKRDLPEPLRRDLPRASRRRVEGVTLLEVLVVIVIFSMILGMTIGILRNSNRDLGVMAATNTVAGLLRAAGEHARAENSPAWVAINVDERTAGTLIRESLVMCHFEDTSGGYNTTIQVQGPIQVLGRVGLAYRFAGMNIIDAGEIPRLAADQGMAIEMWFNRAPGTGKHVLATIGKDMELMVDAMGRIHARVGSVTATSGSNLVPREWWVYVQAIYNGREIKILINGVEAGSIACRHAWSGPGRLILGAKKDGLAGLMDEVRVSGIVPGDLYMLPPQVEFELPRNARVQNGEFLVAFDPTGRLDATRHPGGDLTMSIKSPVVSKTIVVTRQGLVRR